ncbi:MAG: dihydroneopterin aldolase [Planctomycetes bacterium]|nr:dihydroneopterin aldolase [Planctomycetota bacterium]
MIGTILLEGLEVNCIIGIHPHERVEPQSILVDCEMDHDLAQAAATDDIAATIDYSAVAGLLRDLAVEGRYQLIETYVEEAAARIIERFGALRVMLKVMKPDAVPEARWSAVRIERRS